MRYASLTARVAPADDTDPWEVHERALARLDAGEEVTLLSIGQEADRRTPDGVVEAAVESLRGGRHHYTDVRGTGALRAAIARYHARLTGRPRAGRSPADIDRVTVFAGAQNALFACAQVLLEPGDEVVLVAPHYTTYPATFAASGATLVTVETEAARAHRLDTAALVRALTPRTRAIVLNVPGNPTGRCPDEAALATLVATCVERGIWLILDAVYLDIVEAGEVALPHALPGADEVLVTVGSLSKSHRMSGWRIGWAVGPPALGEHFANLSMCMHYGLPPFVQDAAVVALERAADTPRAVRAALAARRALAREALGDPAPARLLDGGRGMFVLLDVAPLGIDARTFALALLERHAVAVLPCTGFGAGGETLVRIGLCVDGERLARACRAVRDCVAEHRLEADADTDAASRDAPSRSIRPGAARGSRASGTARR